MLKIILAALIGAGLLAGCGSRSIATPGALSGTSAGNTTSSVSSLASNYSTVVWEDDFRTDPAGAPSSTYWAAETGNGVEYGNAGWGNNEAEYYLPGDATVASGALLLHGHADTSVIAHNCGTTTINNCLFSSAKITSLKTVDLSKPGFLEVEADLPTGVGSWPAIWTLGIKERWPSNGEIDIMEFYRIRGIPTILGNFAWGTEERGRAKWDDMKIPLSDFTSKDPGWVRKFHTWRMDWDADSIVIYLDDRYINSVSLDETINPGGFNPFRQPHYILLNLALGTNGGDPVKSKFPITYEVDYVRIYQKNQ